MDKCVFPYPQEVLNVSNGDLCSQLCTVSTVRDYYIGACSQLLLELFINDMTNKILHFPEEGLKGGITNNLNLGLV